jgi:2'-5' RNA ligase
MKNIPEAHPWGSLALVTYIPDPLCSLLQDVRDVLPGNDDLPAHITLLPPRRLRVPVETASTLVHAALGRFSAFDVELSRVRRFDQTNFLYLDLSEGDAHVHDLHDALNTGDLADIEEFEFRPHLTLGGPVAAAELEFAQHQAELTWDGAPCSPRFTIDEIAFLWLGPDSSQREWRRLWTHRLSAKAELSSAAAAAVASRTSSTGRRGR